MTTWAVYRHYDGNGVLLYVGHTKNLRARQHFHRNYARWGHQIAKTRYRTFTTKPEAREAEQAAIETLAPLYNQRTAKARLTTRERYRAWYQKRREHVLSKARARYQQTHGKNAQQERNNKRTYYQRNREKVLAQKRAWYEKNQAKMQGRHRAYRQKQGEGLRTRRREAWATAPEEKRRQKREYMRAYMREYTRRQNAKKQTPDAGPPGQLELI